MVRFNGAEVTRLAQLYGKAEKDIRAQVNKALLKGKIPLGVKPLKSAKAIKRMFAIAEKLEKNK